ncbi:MAG TPA: DUF1573 domain-containing protein [Candidatus Binataceae bacterium]|nr:DUF1573 domain-containing protein [Candidatus Binataceae bacterium]
MKLYRRLLLLTVAATGLAATPPGVLAQGAGNLSNPLQGGFSSSTASGLSDLTGGTSGGVPTAKVGNATYDFGSVFQGTKVRHTFRIDNAGPGSLTIGAVQTSCGCTVAAPTRTVVPAGSYSEITATFDTSADKGPAERDITVATNDPHHQQLVLKIKGDVKVKVDANPSPLVFDKVRHGSANTRTVMLTDMVSHDFRIVSIKNTNPNLKVAEQPRTDGKPGAQLTVTLMPTAPAEPFSDDIQVATNLGPVEIPVSGSVVGDLNVAPAQVSFGIVQPHAGAVRYARLTNSGPRPIKVVGVSTNNLGVSARVDPITPGREYKLTLQLEPNSPDGTLRGAVAIKTDDPSQPTLQVPFYGIVGAFNG